MPNLNFKITNPQALEIINRFKSGDIKTLIFQKISQYRFYISGAAIFLVILISILIGKGLLVGKPAPVFTPPGIDITPTTVEDTRKTVFRDLREDLISLNTSLPDPALPELDNNINLEKPEI